MKQQLSAIILFVQLLWNSKEHWALLWLGQQRAFVINKKKLCFTLLSSKLGHKLEDSK